VEYIKGVNRNYAGKHAGGELMLIFAVGTFVYLATISVMLYNGLKA